MKVEQQVILVVIYYRYSLFDTVIVQEETIITFGLVGVQEPLRSSFSEIKIGHF